MENWKANNGRARDIKHWVCGPTAAGWARNGGLLALLVVRCRYSMYRILCWLAGWVVGWLACVLDKIGSGAC